MLSLFRSKKDSKNTEEKVNVDVENHNIYTDNDMSDTEHYNIYTSDDESESEFVTQGEKSSRKWKVLTKKLINNKNKSNKNNKKWKQLASDIKSKNVVDKWEKVVVESSLPSSPKSNDIVNNNEDNKEDLNNDNNNDTKKDSSTSLSNKISSSSLNNPKKLSIKIPSDAEVDDKEYQDKVAEAKSYNYKYSQFNVGLPTKVQKKPEAGAFIRERDLTDAYDRFMTKVLGSSHTGGCFVPVKKYSSSKLARIMLEFESQFASKGVQIIICKAGSNSVLAYSAARFWIEFVDIDVVGPMYADMHLWAIAASKCPLTKPRAVVVHGIGMTRNGHLVGHSVVMMLGMKKQQDAQKSIQQNTNAQQNTNNNTHK